MLSKFYLTTLTLVARATAATLSTTKDDANQPSELVQWLRNSTSSRDSAVASPKDTSSILSNCDQGYCPDHKTWLDLIWFKFTDKYYIRGSTTCGECSSVTVGAIAIQNIAICGVPLLVDINYKSGYGYVYNYNNKQKACFTVQTEYTCGGQLWMAWPKDVWDC